MSGRIPSVLEPYLRLPPRRSLTILTSILGTSVNWLVLRFLYIALVAGNVRDQDEQSKNCQVVLVSFLRDWSFWRDSAARLGLDLELLTKQHRFRYIDGLTRLFQPGGKPKTQKSIAEPFQYLQEPNVHDIKSHISDCIASLERNSSAAAKTVLIIDNVDLLLAGLPSSTSALSAMLLSLRENVQCMVLSLAADTPLIQQPSTPLESEHAAFVIGLAHQARLVMSARALSSGVAAEVSGVLRVKSDENEGEWLYFVGKDGGVKVWIRGEN